MSINRVVISGNLTQDPELRRTQSGMAILGFRMAVNDRRRNNQTGEWEDYANFIGCKMFGNRGESLSNILAKGMKVAVEGKLRWSEWEGNDGQKRNKIEVIVDELEFMSQRNNGGQGGYQQGGSQQGGQGGYQQGGQGGYQQGGQGGYQQGSQDAGYQAPSAAPAPAPVVDASSSVYDEDIPF